MIENNERESLTEKEKKVKEREKEIANWQFLSYVSALFPTPSHAQFPSSHIAVFDFSCIDIVR